MIVRIGKINTINAAVIFLISVILVMHYIYMKSAFITEFDLHAASYSLDKTFEYIFIDKLYEINYLVSNYENFILINVFIVISQLAIAFTPVAIIFNRIFSIESVIYLLFCLASSKIYLFSYSGVALSYVLPIPLTLILYIITLKIIEILKYRNIYNLNKKGYLYLFLLIITITSGLIITPRFIISVLILISWLMMRYINNYNKRLNINIVLKLSIIIIVFLGLVYIIGGLYNRNYYTIVENIQSNPIDFIKGLGFISWTFLCISPLIPILVMNSELWIVYKRNKIYFLIIIIFITVILIVLIGERYIDGISKFNYIKYILFSILVIPLGIKSLNTENRSGIVGFLFLNFIISYFFQSILLLQEPFRQCLYVPYMYMIISIFIGRGGFKFNIPKNISVYKKRLLIVLFNIMLSISFVKIFYEIYDSQIKFIYQNRINYQNSIGWKNFTEIKKKISNLDYFTRREYLLGNIRYSLYKISNYVSNIKQNDIRIINSRNYYKPNEDDNYHIYTKNYIPYFTLYRGIEYANRNRLDLISCQIFLSIDDSFVKYDDYSNNGISNKIEFLKSLNSNMYGTKEIFLSRGIYFLIIEKSKIDTYTFPKYMTLISNNSKASHFIEFKETKDYHYSQINIKNSGHYYKIKFDYMSNINYILPAILFKKANTNPLNIIEHTQLLTPSNKFLF